MARNLRDERNGPHNAHSARSPGAGSRFWISVVWWTCSCRKRRTRSCAAASTGGLGPVLMEDFRNSSDKDILYSISTYDPTQRILIAKMALLRS